MPQYIRILLITLTLAFSGVIHAKHPSEPSDGTVNSFRKVAPPKPLPDTLLIEDSSGARVNLSRYKGKTVLLNLWATWCPPCLRELPALDRLQSRLGGDDFAVVTISLDKGGAKQAIPFFARLKIENLPLLVDPTTSLANFFPVDVLPSNFIISSDGKVTHLLRGFVDWDLPQTDLYFENIMRSKPKTELSLSDN